MTETPISDLSRLCVHTATTKPWSVDVAAEKYAAAGVKGITVWRDALVGRDVVRAGNRLRALGLAAVSLCRGGFFPAADTAGRLKAIDENKRSIDEAAALGAPLVVLVCGALPGQPLEISRNQIREGIEAVLPAAEKANVRLGIEPLHPMYADSRSAINTMRQANDMAESFASPWLGVVVDVYHTWWDPDLESEIRRCGKNQKLFAFHLCDWKTPTVDLLNDRGLMGEGCIPLRQIRGWVEETAFTGFHEVEIFSNRYWATDQDAFLKQVVKAYLNHC